MIPSGQGSTVVFGISGATWDIARPLLSKGRLPNLEYLMARGASMTLASVRTSGDRHYRPQVAWTSVATGCLPERHGVTAFYHTADDCRMPTVWQAFHDAGHRVGIFGWPITWPPPQLNGFVVPDYHARDDTTWPPELAGIRRFDRAQFKARRGEDATGEPGVGSREVAALAWQLWRNGVRPRAIPALLGHVGEFLVSRDRQKRALAVRHAKLEISWALCERLIRAYRPGLATFHSFLVDVVSHRYWRYRDEAASGKMGRLAAAVDDAYIHTDRILGRLLRTVPEQSLIAVLSEHGMAGEPISAELGDTQYLIRGKRVLDALGLSEVLLPVPVARWVALRAVRGGVLPCGLMQRLRAITVVDTGLPLFSVYAHGAEEVVIKLSLSSDVPRYAQGGLDELRVVVGERCVPFLEITRKAGPVRSAMHNGDAMCVIAGPGIRPGTTQREGSILDVAPTLLAAAGIPPLPATDGRVLEIF